MLKRIKRLFLIIPVLACLFGINNINQVSASSVHANINNTIASSARIPATSIIPISNIGLNNDLTNLLQTQDRVKPLVNSNAIEEYTFRLFGCFYFLSITTDDDGEIVCSVSAVTCGTHTNIDYVGGEACLDD